MYWHPRTGLTTYLLHLPTTAELVVPNPIPQHDPHSNSQLASHRRSRLPQTFLDQFTAVKLFQLWIPAYCMDDGFTPEKAQQRIALLGQTTQSLPPSTGIFSRDHPYITSQRFAVCESSRISQKHVRR